MTKSIFKKTLLTNYLYSSLALNENNLMSANPLFFTKLLSGWLACFKKKNKFDVISVIELLQHSKYKTSEAFSARMCFFNIV